MKNILKSIKDTLHRISFSFKVDGIRSDVRQFFKEESASGDIVEVVNHYSKWWQGCPPGFPSDYYSESNCEDRYTIKTESGEVFIIEQGRYGFIWDGPPKRTSFTVSTEDGEIVYSSEIAAQRKLINKQTKGEN